MIDLTDESKINDRTLNTAYETGGISVIAWYNETTQELKEIWVNDFWQMLQTDWKLDVALWNISWVEQFWKFWTNLDIDTGSTPEDVWGGWGLYTGFPLWAAETLEIFSDSILDNWVTPNTWARTVTISKLLDENYIEMPDVTVTLNGTTPVSLWAQTYLRCSRAFVNTAWSTWNNVWTLTIRHTTTTTNVFARMPLQKNQTTIMAFTVPAWKQIVVDKIFLSMWRLNWNSWSANINLRIRPLGWVFNAKKDTSITNSSNYVYENNWYLVIDEKSDVTMRVQDVSDNDTFVSAEVNWYTMEI